MIPTAALRAALFSCALACAHATPAPVELLFGNVDYNSVALSPDGRRLATVFAYGDKDERRIGLAVIDVATKQARPIVRQRDANVAQIGWINNDRLFATLNGYFWRRGFYSFDADGQRMCEILPLALDDADDRRMLLRRAAVIHVDRASQTLLAARVPPIGHRDVRRSYLFGGEDPSPAVYRIDPYTGEFRTVARDPGRTATWVVDPKGAVRVAWGRDPAGFDRNGVLRDRARLPGQRAYWIDDAGNATPLEGIAFGERENSEPLGFDPTGELFLFVGRQGADRSAVFGYRWRQKTIEGPVLASDTVDLTASDAIYSPHDGTVVGMVIEESRRRVAWLTPPLQALAREIDAALPEFLNTFKDWTADLKRVLVQSRSSIEPGRYYLFDAEAGTLEEVFARVPELRKHDLVAAAPVSFRARDGVTLHGYLAKPKAAGKNTSFILMVHGGPWVRETAAYEPMLQFLVSRGYTVLTVNFRGSAGFGRRFEDLGRRQFGTGMIDDLFDAVEWAVREGHASRDRLAIAGASYGGYAVLRAMTLAPDRFKAGISLLPVADLVRQMHDYKRKEHQLAYAFWSEWVGDPTTEAQQLKDISPVNHLARLKAPVFVSYGEDDDRIDTQHSSDLVRQLRAHRKTFVSVEAKDAGHNFGDEAMRIKVFTQLEQFLARHFPAR